MYKAKVAIFQRTHYVIKALLVNPMSFHRVPGKIGEGSGLIFAGSAQARASYFGLRLL
jgi:hypothetical protein